ncbi:hypothetical protein D3C81_1987400 [compost metagenome]
MGVVIRQRKGMGQRSVGIRRQLLADAAIRHTEGADIGGRVLQDVIPAASQ